MNMFHRFAATPAIAAILLLFPTGLARAGTGPPGTPQASQSPAWEIDVPETPVPMICALPEAIVIALREGRLTAHSVSGGELMWEARLPGPISRPPVCSPERIGVILDDGAFLLLAAATGETIAGAPGGPAGAMLSVLPSGLAASDPGGGLRLFRPRDGQMIWSRRIEGAFSVAPSQCGDLILAGTRDGRLVALGAADGAVKWQRRLGEAITTPAACKNKWVYVGSADNRLHCLKMKRKKAKRRWTFLTGGDLSGRPLLAGRLVVFLSYDTYLYALDTDNGHLAWKVRLGRRPQPDLLAADDELFLAPLNSETLEALRLPEGARAVAHTLESGSDRFVTAPVLAGDTIAIAAARYGEESSRVLGFRLTPSAGR